MDGESKSRKGTISAFDGPGPSVRVWSSADAEAQGVGTWISERMAQSVAPHEIAGIVRSDAEIPRALAAVEASKQACRVLDDQMVLLSGKACVCTLHLAKGLEFRAVAVMACDDQIIPSQSRIDAITDEADLEEVYSTERHLLYVAATRARDQLLVTAAVPGSAFLDNTMGELRPTLTRESLAEVSDEQFSFGKKIVHVACPELQHAPALVRVFGAVVHTAYTADRVVQRLLDNVGVESRLVEPG